MVTFSSSQSTPQKGAKPYSVQMQSLRFRHFLALTAFAITVGATALMVAGALVLPTNGDTMYPETANILPGIALLRTGHVYPDFNSYPFFASVYGPLFYFIVAIAAHIAKSQLLSVLIIGRVLAYLCFLATAALVYLSARRLGHKRSFAALAGAGVLFCADFYSWNATFRPDVPAVMFGVAAISLVLREKLRTHTLIAAGLCASAAALLKQSIFMAALAIALWLVTNKRFREATVFIATAALPVILVFGFLQSREPALQRVMALRYTPKDIPSAITIVQHAIFRADGALLMTFALIAIFVARRHQLLLLYFGCSWTLTVLALSQIGANANYLLEGWTACALLVPVALESFEIRWPQLHFAWRLTLILGIVAVLAGQSGLWKYFTAKRMPHSYGSVALLRDYKIFGDVPYLTGSGRDPELPEPFLAHMFAITGHWSPSSVAARIDARKYDIIFVASDRGSARGWRGVANLDPVLFDRINVDYDILCATPTVVALTPNSREVSFTTAIATEVLGRPCLPVPSRELSSQLKFEPYRAR